MKTPLIVSLLALVLGAVALVTSLLNSSSCSARAQAPTLPVAAAPAAELLARVEALAEENRELRDRLVALELRPTPVLRAPVTDPGAEAGASEEELAAIRDEVREALVGRGGLEPWAPGQPTSPEFTARVQQSMAEIRVQEAIEGAKKQVASRAGRLKERMGEVSQKLGLTVQQEAAMETTLVGLYETQASYKVLFVTGEVENREDFRPISENDMKVFHEELGGILTPQQYADYQSLEGDLFPGIDGGKGR